MTSKESVYKVTLSGGDILMNEKPVSEAIALKIITLIMGASINPQAMHSLENTEKESGVATAISGDNSSTPKSFMALKKPASEIERITCLAYYLAYHRETPMFKTRDLTKLNTEAAMKDFTNASVSARNAASAQYLAKAGGGNKQITSLGEAVVNALPDREKVKKAIQDCSLPKKKTRSKKSKTKGK